MTDLVSGPADATPLTDEERQGLRLPVITRDDLNRAEADNISHAMSWLFFSRRRLQPALITREAWLKSLHRRMYDQVWTWAGQYRTTDRNLGVPFWQVRVNMRNVEADVNAWLADRTPARYTNDECAIRFGYRLAVIHPFPNGNGRWSRLASDALVVALGGARFTWGRAFLTEPGVLRRDYISALQSADTSGDFGPLMAFSRR